MLSITVNGEPRQFAAAISVAELLAELKIPERGVAVEINLEIVPRREQTQRLLRDGDRLEIVSLVGGG
jgi:sulfur carrier protein